MVRSKQIQDMNHVKIILDRMQEYVVAYEKQCGETPEYVLEDWELENKTLSMESIIPAYDRFKSWIEEYTYLPSEQKRMVLCELISRIEISRGYEIKIMFDIEYNQFCEMQEDDLPLHQL